MDAQVNTAQVQQVTSQSGQTFAGLSGQAANAGACLYQDNSAGLWWPGTCTNQLGAGVQNGLAFSLNPTSGPNQPIALQRSGIIYLGANSLVDGEQYVVSVSPGNIGAAQDRLAGQFDSYVGYALNTNSLQLPQGGPVYKSEARTTNA